MEAFLFTLFVLIGFSITIFGWGFLVGAFLNFIFTTIWEAVKERDVNTAYSL